MEHITKEDWINLSPASGEFSEYTGLLDEMVIELKKFMHQFDQEGESPQPTLNLIHRYEELKYRRN